MSSAFWAQLDSSSGLGETYACVHTQLLGGLEVDCAKLTHTGWHVLLPLAMGPLAGWPGLVAMGFPGFSEKQNRDIQSFLWPGFRNVEC